MFKGRENVFTKQHKRDNVLLGRVSNRDPDYHRKNSIHDSNNDNSNNNTDDLTNLGDGSLYHIFKCGSRRCQFQNKFIPVNNLLSTTTNRLYNCIVTAGSTYVNDHSSNVVCLITWNKCKLQYVGEISQNLKDSIGVIPVSETLLHIPSVKF